MNDPREEILKKIKFDDISISEYPKIAFICGGVPNPVFNPATNSNSFPSVRSYISNCLTANYSKLQFQNAEDIQDWNNYSLYNDLIEFEKDIAHICKVIVLIVESPGSIAELGSFSVIREISEKLIVFVNEKYTESTSFISLGALKKIKSENENCVHYIGWDYYKERDKSGFVDITTLNKWRKYTCDSINEALENRSKYNRSEEECIRTKEALFIHDLIMFFKALTEDEIRAYFKLVKHTIKYDLISKAIFCLNKLGLVYQVVKGNKTFFIPAIGYSERFLALPVRLDTARFAMQLHEYYQHSSHMLRREAIAAIKIEDQK